VLPPNAQSEWNQPLVQEVASDTKWGKQWAKVWSFNPIKLLTGRFKEVFNNNPTMVEAGTLTLVNPTDRLDKTSIPILVTKDSRQKSALGGGEVLQTAAQVSEKAANLMNKAQKITERRMSAAHLPAEIPNSMIPPTKDKDESLSRAYSNTRELLMAEGVRPSLVLELATTYAIAILNQATSSSQSLVVGNYFETRAKTEQYEQIQSITKALENKRLSDKSRQKLEDERKKLIQQLRKPTLK
jgi:ribonucleotide reductase alpha subunit